MIMILSPAKTLDFKTVAPTTRQTMPLFEEEASGIARIMKKLNAESIANLMSLSKVLAELNFERFQHWEQNSDPAHRKQAIFAYKGDVYIGLDAYSWKEEKIDFAQNHLRILSGLYGYLRPLDLIQPYRLEMGTRLKIKSAKDLVEFWTRKNTKALLSDLQLHQSKALINLASHEYSASIDFKKLKVPVISPQFLDYSNGDYKMISFFAKRARGSMASYICDHKLYDPADIVAFDREGYYYNTNLSSQFKPVFTRDIQKK